ncbi:LpqB family beta-propeller domain-containing protein [Streptomyces hoynatensis]|uniref:Uncharacterized protein n=1 Tax=Streptomyces hoynatensis TaxID=1141874 RepID=A0A3A9YUX7_9ACTN|nr:LpqB family beta-propeller domain-containing protein [Streptomyces hoynatensis]RKN39842.1 hypothetical protein D7294_20700 [Streptomyces hoynatensis]
MRRERAGAGRWRLLGLLAAGLALAGCASMPGSGPVQRVDSSQRADADSPVRVWAEEPEEGATPQQIVRGFLEAVTSDDPSFETAKLYLTPRQREQWDPFESTTVLSGGPDVGPIYGEPEPGSGDVYRIELSGTRLATVDAAHAYTPRDGAYETTLQLRLVDGEWRIDSLPPGLVVGESDFRRIYRPVNLYYYADLGAEAGRVAHGADVLVADPIYVRRRIQPVEEAVRTLLNGPGDWLAPVVSSAFPEGVGLAEGHPPTVDESGALPVWLTGVPTDWPLYRCERMAAQLLHTASNVASAEVTEAKLYTESGDSLCSVSAGEAGDHAPGLLDGDLARPYFVDGDQRLVAAADEDGGARPVPGALGEEDAGLRSAAVSRDGDQAAGVSADGSELLVAPLTGGKEAESVYSSGSSGEGAGLSAPSWDGLGDLWVADLDPDRPRLLRLSGGAGEAQEIPVDGLHAGETIQALRLASDGVRIAVLVDNGSSTSLKLGRVKRSDTGQGVVAEVDGLRPVAPQLADVAAVSWAGGSRLVVVGRPADGVEQLLYVETDGSTASTATVPGLNDVTGVAASEDENEPLLAQTGTAIALLQDNAQWKRVDAGLAPVYPG